MISKELLNEVIGVDVCDVEMSEDKRYIEFKRKNDDMLSFAECELINIYELSHKCKEWAFSKGYEIESRIIENNTGLLDSLPFGYSCIYIDGLPRREFRTPTEPEAIFKACQWILEQQNVE